MSILRFHLAGAWNAISVRWVPSSWRRDGRVEPLIESAWQRATATPGVKLFDGPMCRMESWDGSRDPLVLALSHTSYKPFLGTNLANPQVATTIGRDVLANPVGVSPALLSADGRLVMGRRNGSVAYYPHRVHPFSGALEPRERLDVFDEVRRELREELTFGPSDVASIVCTGIAEDVSILQPELIFIVRSTQNCDAILARVLEDEHHAAWSCQATPAGIERALRSAEPFTPVAIAALLLFGRVGFGVEWFDRVAAAYRVGS